MSFNELKITTYQDSVSALPDYPSDAGITAAQLKAVFDGRTDKEIKQKFNALIDELITKFGLVEVDIADAVEGHNQQEDAHERIITPIKTSIEDILTELLSMNIAIKGKADAAITETQLSALDLFISGTTNKLHDHTGARDNPHEVTKAQVGLDKVDNTPDSEKEVAFAISAEKDSLGNSIHEHYATKAEVENKVDKVAGKGLSTYDFNDEWKQSIQNSFNEAIYAQTAIDNHIMNEENPHKVTPAQIGLGNVDNTRDSEKSVAYAEMTMFAGIADAAERDSYGNVIHETYATKEEVGDIGSALDAIIAIQESYIGGDAE